MPYCKGLKEHFCTTQDVAILRSVDLVVQIWLGLNVCSVTPLGGMDPWNTRVQWEDGETLQSLVASQFNKLRKPTGPGLQFDAFFTAAGLKHVCRLRFRWTWNLIDHLVLSGTPGERTLSIYQHKVCLLNHIRAGQTTIDVDLLVETVRTLELLFPLGGLPTEALLEEEGISMHAVRAGGSDHCPQSTDEFAYWRSRLEVLHNLLHGPPENRHADPAWHSQLPPMGHSLDRHRRDVYLDDSVRDVGYRVRGEVVRRHRSVI